MPRARMRFALLLLLFTVRAGAAEPPLPLTLERIVSHRPALSGTAPAEATWSPDGKLLAFLWNDPSIDRAAEPAHDVVPFQTSVMLVQEMVKAHNRFEFAFTPTATHAWSAKEDDALYLFGRLVDFFERWIPPGTRDAPTGRAPR